MKSDVHYRDDDFAIIRGRTYKYITKSSQRRLRRVLRRNKKAKNVMLTPNWTWDNTLDGGG